MDGAHQSGDGTDVDGVINDTSDESNDEEDGTYQRPVAHMVDGCSDVTKELPAVHRRA